GAGLGDRFLGHAERCGAILHLVDGTQAAIAKSYRAVRRELEAYGRGLSEKPEIVALNKIDAIPRAQLAKKRATLERACGREIFLMSGVSGEGVERVLRALATLVARARGERSKTRAPAGAWSP
ncbi:MAG TPA: hypothetical protein VHC42_13045, partial [Rhizomicrobium sp.]|nr:hypothetical protein [Rhizomicrobium sp.]